MIYIKNTSVLNERRRNLRSATSLFNLYQERVDNLNCVKISKDALAEELNVTSRTVANWLRALSDAGVIKYKYSGSARLNPKIYFSGSEENYIKALSEYERFHGDL